MTDEDELTEAEAGIRLWFEENAQPQEVFLGSNTLNNKRDQQYKEVVLLAPESLARTAASFEQQQHHLAQDGAVHRELIKALALLENDDSYPIACLTQLKNGDPVIYVCFETDGHADAVKQFKQNVPTYLGGDRYYLCKMNKTSK
ncbi:hypothetical protein HDU86_000984 [Geranomyces michiganensis]|nr:hypothetical protein HDU86_000984 [Geranomyces michiganensis]